MSVTAKQTFDKRAEIERRILNRRIKDFVERWAPHGRGDNSAFSADLMMLVAEIHRDASQPMLEVASAAFMMRPLEPVLVKSEGAAAIKVPFDV